MSLQISFKLAYGASVQPRLMPSVYQKNSLNALFGLFLEEGHPLPQQTQLICQFSQWESTWFVWNAKGGRLSAFSGPSNIALACIALDNRPACESTVG
nr:MAG: hypothetical protein EDM05_26055 [Leptolyngbya sp. IPPAS B-1204]